MALSVTVDPPGSGTASIEELTHEDDECGGHAITYKISATPSSKYYVPDGITYESVDYYQGEETERKSCSRGFSILPSGVGIYPAEGTPSYIIDDLVYFGCDSRFPLHIICENIVVHFKKLKKCTVSLTTHPNIASLGSTSPESSTISGISSEQFSFTINAIPTGGRFVAWKINDPYYQGFSVSKDTTKVITGNLGNYDGMTIDCIAIFVPEGVILRDQNSGVILRDQGIWSQYSKKILRG